MKLSKKKLGVLVGAALSLGVAGQASADVYGLSYLQVDNLLVKFNGSVTAPPVFTFATDQNATLGGVADPTDGSNGCGGITGLGNDCGLGSPRLSGIVQNAPGSTSIRGENDYTKFGSAGNYSNAEAAIVTAVLTGDPATSTKSISESNISSVNSAAANTNVSSNTSLTLDFTVAEDGGAFSIAFDAVIDVLSKATGVDIGAGLAQANSGLTVLLQKGGITLASWAPTGNNVVNCDGSVTCTATESKLSLNNTTSSTGAANQVSGSGKYLLEVAGLTTGEYTLALADTTSTALRRFPTRVPVPGTLFLMGAGLLAAARSLRRSTVA